MSSAAYKIDQFNNKIVVERGPLPHNWKFIKEGVVKFYYELRDPSGVVALVYDPQDNLLGRIHGWHRERLWVENVQQAFVDTLQPWADEPVAFSYL